MNKSKKKELPSIEELRKAQNLFKIYCRYVPKIEMIEIKYRKNGIIDIIDKENETTLKLERKKEGGGGTYQQ